VKQETLTYACSLIALMKVEEKAIKYTRATDRVQKGESREVVFHFYAAA
jgi:hypothetical protein